MHKHACRYIYIYIYVCIHDMYTCTNMHAGAITIQRLPRHDRFQPNGLGGNTEITRIQFIWGLRKDGNAEAVTYMYVLSEDTRLVGCLGLCVWELRCRESTRLHFTRIHMAWCMPWPAYAMNKAACMVRMRMYCMLVPNEPSKIMPQWMYVCGCVYMYAHMHAPVHMYDWLNLPKSDMCISCSRACAIFAEREKLSCHSIGQTNTSNEAWMFARIFERWERTSLFVCTRVSVTQTPTICGMASERQYTHIHIHTCTSRTHASIIMPANENSTNNNI
jgi:hypothetical protein